MRGCFYVVSCDLLNSAMLLLSKLKFYRFNLSIHNMNSELLIYIQYKTKIYLFYVNSFPVKWTDIILLLNLFIDYYNEIFRTFTTKLSS